MNTTGIDNDYFGTTNINTGTVLITTNTALGQGGGGFRTTFVADGATLFLQGGITVPEDLDTLDGLLENVSDFNTWTGVIILGEDATIQTDVGSTLVLSGDAIELDSHILTFQSDDATFVGAEINSTCGCDGSVWMTGFGTLTILNNDNFYGDETRLLNGTTILAGGNQPGPDLNFAFGDSTLLLGDGGTNAVFLQANMGSLQPGQSNHCRCRVGKCHDQWKYEHHVRGLRIARHGSKCQ